MLKHKKSSLLSLAVFLLMLLVPALSFADGIDTSHRSIYSGDDSEYNSNNYETRPVVGYTDGTSGYSDNSSYSDNSGYSDYTYSYQTNAQDETYEAFLGLGVRAVGLYQSPIKLAGGDCINMNIFGGAGWYLKFRVSERFTLEFVNDFIYAKYRDHYGDVLRVPISLGLQAHILNYSWWNLYGVGALTVNVHALLNGGDQSSLPLDGSFATVGAQFGLGFSRVIRDERRPYAEIGFDIRYTIEQAPKYSVFGTVNKQYPIHGVLFALNIGMSAP